MRLFLSIVLFTFSMAAFSQAGKGLTSMEFEQLKKDYAQMTKSKTYRAMIVSSKLAAQKLNGPMPSTVKTEADFNEWIEKNISKTNFSSVAEAKSIFNETKTLAAKNREEYKDVWKQLLKASPTQISQLKMAELSEESKTN